MNKNLTEIIRNLVIKFVNEKHYIPNEKEMKDIEAHANKICNILEETQNPLDEQIGGNHYKKYAIQPIEFIHANKIPFIEGNIIKYICRWRDKNGVKDLEKVEHYIRLLKELEKL